MLLEIIMHPARKGTFTLRVLLFFRQFLSSSLYISLLIWSNNLQQLN